MNEPVQPGRVPGRRLAGPPDAPYWEPVLEIPWRGGTLQGPKTAPPPRAPGQTAEPAPPATRPPPRQPSQQQAPPAAREVTAERPFTAHNFRANLARRTGGIPEGAHAHHVFPLQFAEPLRRAGIDVNDPRYGAWWEASAHLRNATAYNAAWQRLLETNPSTEQILQFGRDIAIDHGLQIGF